MGRDRLEMSVIRSVDPGSKEAGEIHTVVAEALGVRQSIEDTLRQVDLLEGNSLIVAGRIDGRLATMNIFMPQRFSSGGKDVLGFQSGFSATGNAYRGQGLWPKLLTASEAILADEGAQFIFGYPNPVSHPLFIKKLGYETIQMQKAYILAAACPLYRTRKRTDYITPDIAQTERWKKRVKGDSLVSYHEGDQRGFGLLREKAGVNFLEIGAFDPGGGTVGSCLGKMCKSANVALCTVESTAGSQFLPALTFRRRSRPFIFKPVDPAFVRRPFDGFGGLADVF